MILADQKIQENDREGAIEVIETLYALYDAEAEAAKVLGRSQGTQKNKERQVTSEPCEHINRDF